MKNNAGSYTTAISVDRPPSDAYAAIVNVRSWWSQEIDGPTDEIGGEFDYHYGDVHRCRVRVTELDPGRRVAWRIVENHFNFVANQQEWVDTEIVFDIARNGGGADIRFSHVGLVPQHECYDVCSNAWAGYITGSLRELINTGTGQPNPKEDVTLPGHQQAANAERAALSTAAGA